MRTSGKAGSKLINPSCFRVGSADVDIGVGADLYSQPDGSDPTRGPQEPAVCLRRLSAQCCASVANTAGTSALDCCTFGIYAPESCGSS